MKRTLLLVAGLAVFIAGCTASTLNPGDDQPAQHSEGAGDSL